MSDLCDVMANAAAVRDAFLRCGFCGREARVDGVMALRAGWPKCCEASMELVGWTAPADSAGGDPAQGRAYRVNVDGQPTEWGLVPPRYRGGLDRWITAGIKPGGFLCALLANDLAEALTRVDDIAALRPILLFMRSNAPPACFGAPAVLDTWRGTEPQPEG